jgi:type IV pilus biogenesis protein CpaD/CtpE
MVQGLKVMRALCLIDRIGSVVSVSGFTILIRNFAMLAAAAAIAGCVSSSMEDGVSIEDSKPEMTLASIKTRHDVSMPKLAHFSDQELSDWFRSIVLQSHAFRPESLTVTVFGPWSSQRQSVLKHEAARLGLPQKSLLFQPGNSIGERQQLFIVIEKNIVAYAGCQNKERSEHKKIKTPEFPHQLGCSTALDLGQIVADPRDLSQ